MSEVGNCSDLEFGRWRVESQWFCHDCCVSYGIVQMVLEALWYE